jgi:hypothetical protein
MTGKAGDNQYTEVNDNIMDLKKAEQGTSRAYTPWAGSGLDTDGEMMSSCHIMKSS